ELLSDIEKAHGVSFVCKSELLDIKVSAGKLNFLSKQYIQNLQKLLGSLNMQVKQITGQQFVIIKKEIIKTTGEIVNIKPGEGNVALVADELNQFIPASITTNTT